MEEWLIDGRRIPIQDTSSGKADALCSINISTTVQRCKDSAYPVGGDAMISIGLATGVVNVNGVLFTAQAAGRQMARFGNGGSIILVASMSGTITNKVCHVFPIYTDASACHSKTFTDCAPWQDHAWVSYNTSKSAVLQMARSMACELGPKRIRVNTLSPGHIYTKCVTLVCIFIHLAALTAEHRDHMYDIFVLFLTILPWRALNPPCASGPVINCDRPPNLNPKMDHSFNPISKNMRTG